MSAPLRLRLVGVAVSCATLLPLAARAADAPDLSGTWVWTWKDPTGQEHRHVLELEGVGANLAATERFDDEGPVKVREIQRDGKNVRLTVVRGDRRSEYKGILADSNTINGTVTVTYKGDATDYPWKAMRSQAPK